MALWQDRRGRFSPLRAATLVALVSPALALLYFALTNDLGPRPFTEAIHIAGLWAVRFLMITLLITPLRRIARYPKLVDVRRMIGVATFCYAAAHISLFVADQMFDLFKVASEIVLRIYLTIGFVALLGLAALAVTSTDGMVRRLGRRWQTLHNIVYLAGILALVHFFMQSKADVWEPTVMAGLLVWLLGYRLIVWAYGARGRLPLAWAVLWTVAATLLTAAGEAAYFWLSMGAPLWAVLETNLSFELGLRPAQLVFAISAGVTLLGAVRFATSASSRRAFARA